MDRRQRTLLLIAAVCGIGTTIFAFLTLQGRGGADAIQAILPSRAILAAATELPADRRLEPGDVTVLTIPADDSFDQLYALAVKPEEQATVHGRRLNRPVPAGGPILASDLAGVLDLDLASGKRAMSIAASGADALSGLLVPGDRIDLVVTVPEKPEVQAPPPGRGGGDPAAIMQEGIFHMLAAGAAAGGTYRSEIIVQDIRVLAVGQSLSRARAQFALPFAGGGEGPAPADTVTVEVTEEQARTILEKSGAGTYPVTVLLRQKAGARP